MKKTLQTSLSVRDMVELHKVLADLVNFTCANRMELNAIKKRKRPPGPWTSSPFSPAPTANRAEKLPAWHSLMGSQTHSPRA